MRLRFKLRSLTHSGQRDFPEGLGESLAELSTIMANISGEWWLIGSAAVLLHGSGPTSVADLDILLQHDDARAIADKLGIAIRPPRADNLFRSDIFFTCHDAPLPIEFMAGLQLRIDAKWHRVKPTTREERHVAGFPLFLPSRGELAEILALFGRPKDLARRKLLTG